MTNVINPSAYLRTSREFPEDMRMFSQEVSKTYIDTASAVNNRTIGLFPVNRPAITGESWFLSGSARNQSLRQIYSFGAILAGGVLTIPYQTNGLTQFNRIFGTCITALPDYRPIPFASVLANANIELRVDPSNIIISVGAASPNINSGIIVLEWLSNV